MKNKRLYWGTLLALLLLWLPMMVTAADESVGVSYRGHIQDRGDYPADGSWIDSPEIIGTTGQSKRIEGFEIKLTGAVPAGMELRYNVHVQNKGWLYDEDDCSDWPRDGAYAGTRGNSLRIEAVKIVLTDVDGQPLPGYSVHYRGHVQNIGDLPKAADQWLADGEQLGTVGSSLRLEALLVQVVKTTVDPPEPAEPVVYDAAGSYGPEQGRETIDGDVTVAADGVVLNNLVITGNLTISEAVGDGNVTLNNVTVKGDTLVRGGGKNSIHLNGGQYARIVMEKTASGAVRIVATGVDGLDVVIAEDATGETVILEGVFASVTVNAPSMTVTTQGNTTTIGTLTVGADGAGTILNLATGTTVTDLILDGKAAVKGQGTVTKADVNADGVVFDKAPGSYVVEPDVVIPPVFPNPSGGGGGGGTPSKPTLTISDPTLTTSKVYDGNTSAAVTAGTLSGVAAGDAGNVTVSASASYDNKNVASGNKTIRVVYTLGGPAAVKYNKPADFVMNTGTITAKPLTIASPTLTTVKEFDGNDTAAVTAGGLTNAVAGDQVSATATARYNDATRTDGKTITVVYALGGGDAGNYTAPANYQVSNGEITKKQLTIALTSVTTDKVYNGNPSVVASCGALEGVADNDTVGVVMNAGYDSKDVGDGKTITISYAINGNIDNYLAPLTTTRSGKITARPLTATGVVVTTEKPYDNTTTAAVTTQATVSGALPDETVGVTAAANYNDKKADEGKEITVSYSLTGDPDVTKNYSAPASYEYPTRGKITAIPLIITTPNVTPNKMYDGNVTATVTAGALAGVLGSDAVSAKATASYADAAVNPSKTITVVYTLEGLDAGNYSAPTNDQVTGKIDPKILSYSLTTNSPTKVYDQGTAAPVSAVADSLVGIVNNEEVSIASSTANYNNKDVGTGKAVTVSATLTGADSGNYQAQVCDLTGEITAKQLTVSPVTVTTEKVYDGQLTAAIATGWSVSGELPNETVSAIPTATYDSKNVGEGKEITVSFSLTGNGDVIKNYSAPADQTVNNGKITAKPLTITAPNLTTTKPYDGTTSAAVTAGSLTGKESNDTVTVTPTANYDSATRGNGKTITVVYKLDGTDQLNYSAPADHVVNSGVIDPRQLNITPPQLTISKSFDGTTRAEVTAGTLYNKVTGETVTISKVTATYDSAAVGTGKTITVHYDIDDTTGNYLPPVDYKVNNGIIIKAIRGVSFNGNGWSNLDYANVITMTSLPAGYTIFDLDNDGNFYAGHSNGSIKKYSGGSWSTDTVFSGALPAGTFEFAGIEIYDGKPTALGVVTSASSGELYQNPPNNTGWSDTGTPIINTAGYQLVGSYYEDVNSFYLVYLKDSSLYRYDTYYGTAMEPLASFSEDIKDAIAAGDSICGFNYTNNQLNMYLTK